MALPLYRVISMPRRLELVFIGLMSTKYCSVSMLGLTSSTCLPMTLLPWEMRGTSGSSSGQILPRLLFMVSSGAWL